MPDKANVAEGINKLKGIKIVVLIAMPFVLVLLSGSLLIMSIFAGFDQIARIVFWIVYVMSPIVSFMYLNKLFIKYKVISSLIYFIATYSLMFFIVAILVKIFLGDSDLGSL
jgi:hypothetical protein